MASFLKYRQTNKIHKEIIATLFFKTLHSSLYCYKQFLFSKKS